MGKAKWWVCDDCKSLNDVPANKCYKCRTNKPSAPTLIDDDYAEIGAATQKRVGITVDLSRLSELTAPDPTETDDGAGVYDAFDGADDEPLASSQAAASPASPASTTAGQPPSVPPIRDPVPRGIAAVGGRDWTKDLEPLPSVYAAPPPDQDPPSGQAPQPGQAPPADQAPPVAAPPPGQAPPPQVPPGQAPPAGSVGAPYGGVVPPPGAMPPPRQGATPPPLGPMPPPAPGAPMAPPRGQRPPPPPRGAPPPPPPPGAPTPGYAPSPPGAQGRPPVPPPTAASGPAVPPAEAETDET